MTGICFSCKESKHLTIEHIIPQSLGGRLKKRLFCKECNSYFGRSIDNELSIQFGHIATFLNIKRHRGNTQPVEMNNINTNIKMTFDGTELKRRDPVISKRLNGKSLEFADIRARSEKELKDVIKSIKDKYNVPYEFEVFKQENSGPTDLTYYRKLDNVLLRRAVAKIAYSFLCTKAQKEIIFSSAFDKIREYINSVTEYNMASANYIHTRFMSDYARPLHKIHISYNRSENVLVGFIMLFGIYRFTVLLSDSFRSLLEWPDLDYTFDPVRLAEIYGRDNFRAPALTKSDILHPKQSKELVATELRSGQKIIESYVDNFEFIDCELD